MSKIYILMDQLQSDLGVYGWYDLFKWVKIQKHLLVMRDIPSDTIPCLYLYMQISIVLKIVSPITLTWETGTLVNLLPTGSEQHEVLLNMGILRMDWCK